MVLDLDQIVRMYYDEDRSTYEIAEELGTYPNNIRRFLKRNGYSLKDKSGAQKAALASGRAISEALQESDSQL